MTVAGLARESFPAIGTTATVVVADERWLGAAVTMLRSELDAIDRAASRFRPDSELAAVNAAGGRPVEVSAVLFGALSEAVRAASITRGLVDPTVGEALVTAGYDRDFALLDPDGPAVTIVAHPAPGWKAITLDPLTHTVRLAAGVRVDLGATAKALCADVAARRIARETGSGVLVNLGGDISVAGPPPAGGWSIRVNQDHSDPPDRAKGPVVSISSGGLATSSTSVRRWIRGGEPMHHLIDPATGRPAAEYWRTVSVAAGSCLDANIASCAAVLLGARAFGWLAERNLPARLVHPSGAVTFVADWPVQVPC